MAAEFLNWLPPLSLSLSLSRRDLAIDGGVIDRGKTPRLLYFCQYYLFVVEEPGNLRVRGPPIHLLLSSPAYHPQLAMRRDTKSVLGIILPAASASTFSTFLLSTTINQSNYDTSTCDKACMGGRTFRILGTDGGAPTPIALKLKLKDLHVRREMLPRRATMS
jgi:hypothetical protein